MSRWLWLAGGMLTIGLLGFRSKPKSFPEYSDRTPDLNKVPLPEDLPKPVRRFYCTITDGHVPIIESAVITGRGIVRFGTIPFQARLRFTHRAGYDYRHYIEMTWFNRSIFKLNEHFINGEFKMALPFGTVEGDAGVNSAANQAMWGEALFFPTLFTTDARVQWQSIDDTSAKLIVPYSDDDQETQTFTVLFDSNTNLITRMETVRYRDSESGYVRWILEADQWKRRDGICFPMVAKVRWGDHSYPWLTMNVEDVAFNIDVSDYIQADGI